MTAIKYMTKCPYCNKPMIRKFDSSSYRFYECSTVVDKAANQYMQSRNCRRKVNQSNRKKG